MTGKDKFDAVAKKIKQETEEKVGVDNKEMVEVKAEMRNRTVALKTDQSLARLYNEASGLGSANLSAELPVLKIYTAGRTSVTLADGRTPQDGAYYYKPTKGEYDEVVAHIMTVSSGFRTEGLTEGKQVFTQLVAGVIINDGDMKPFVMYFTGTKLQSLWNFGKEASKYTKMRPVGIPMFALTVTMRTEKQKNKFGESWVPTFEIMTAEDGTPVIVTDASEFIALRDHVSDMEAMIEQIITTKEIDQAEESPAAVNSTPIPSRQIAEEAVTEEPIF